MHFFSIPAGNEEKNFEVTTMRKKEFRKITGLVMVIALFACIFTYRIYADETNTGSQTNESGIQTNENQNGENNTNPADQGNNSDVKNEGSSGTDDGQTGNGESTVTDNDQANNGTSSGTDIVQTDQGNNGGSANGGTVTAVPLLGSSAGGSEGDGNQNPEGQNGEENVNSIPSHEVGDFVVTGNESNYTYDTDNGILTLTGDVAVKNRSGVPTTSNSIIVDGNATVTLEGVNIVAAVGPGITIKLPYSATLVLADESVNKVTGANGVDINATSGDFAGIEVEFQFEPQENPSNRMASLTIEGNGTLYATSNCNGAGIGGSNSAQGTLGFGLYGNITINSGTIIATSPGSGAGIGSSNNPNGGKSIGSYKTTADNVWGIITINGGNITSTSKGSGAGIGGGNHVDSGKIIINGGTVVADGAAGIGCGIGSSKNKGNLGEKGPGYYWTDIEINGGDITATSNDIGAAIGGGMYCDAVILITGGTINATGGTRQGNTHHGGAGIGGGYLGHAEVTITGGNITAVGGDGAAGIGSGGSPNSNSLRDINGRALISTDSGEHTVRVPFTKVNISGGTINATGGPKGGAGIGLGTGADKVDIKVTGGNIEARGAKSSRDEMRGGAGIGSGFYGLGSGSDKYFVQADVSVEIGGNANVLSVGGWGAAGIGSGADNKMANTISLDNRTADIVAYADGTKFAIDTRDLDLTTNITTSHREGRTVEGYILQGTFVHNYTPKDEQGNALVDEQDQVMNQATEGLNDIKIIDDMTGARERNLTGMPEGYRSFAATVSKAGKYNVYTDSAAISNGGGRYFAEYYKDVIDESYWSSRIDQNRFVQYEAKDHELCDNFYLYPVKSIVVDKVVKLEGDAKAEDIDLTTYFAIREKRYVKDENGISVKDESDDAYIKVKDKDGNLVKWIQSIEIVDGVPQNKVYFTNVEDKTYEILEVDKDGNVLNAGTAYGTTILKKIETRHGDAEDNDGVISKEVWTDRVTVINFYTKDSKVDVLIRKILPTEYKFENYKDTTVIFKVEVKDSEENVTYESYVGITPSGEEASFNKDLGRYAYERRLKDIPISSSDTLSVTEVYSAGYQLSENGISITKPNTETNYYLVEALNNVDEYIPGSGAVNSYHNKTHVSKLAVEGGE